MARMRSTQIQLTEKQHKKLTKIAKKLRDKEVKKDASMAWLIRVAVDSFLASKKQAHLELTK